MLTVEELKQPYFAYLLHCIAMARLIPPHAPASGPAVVSYTSSQELVFRGAVLEGLNGKSLDKRLEEDPSFCDIDFLLACLQKVRGWVRPAH